MLASVPGKTNLGSWLSSLGILVPAAYTASGTVTQRVRPPSSPTTAIHAAGPDQTANADVSWHRCKRTKTAKAAAARDSSGRTANSVFVRGGCGRRLSRGSFWRSRGRGRTRQPRPLPARALVWLSDSPGTNHTTAPGALRVLHLGRRK